MQRTNNSNPSGAGTYSANAEYRCDKRPLPDFQQIGFTFEEPEEFKLLVETCPMVLPYMPSIQGRKAHQETQRNTKFLAGILVVVSQAVKHIFLTGFAAFLVDSA